MPHMRTIKTIKISSSWNTLDGQRLSSALMSAKTPDLMRLFIDDLLTKNELGHCIKRLKAVEMLLMGAPYSVVQTSTGLSSRIVARISKRLQDKRCGYCEIMERLHPNGIRHFV